MSAQTRQRLLARFLDDPAFEAQVRKDPKRAAAAHGFELAFARWLAQLDPVRVRAFRKSQVVKAARRGGCEGDDTGSA